MTLEEWIAVGGVGAIGLLVLVVGATIAPAWWRARRAGLRVAWIELVGMRLRRVNLRDVIDPSIRANRHGLPLTTNQLETHALAGGDARAVVEALIEARAKGMSLSWNEAAAYDLGGGDVLAAVRRGVHPRVGVEDLVPRNPR